MAGVILDKATFRREVGEFEFAWFKTLAHDEFARCTKDFERFASLKRLYGVSTIPSAVGCDTDFDMQTRFQISFGKRKMWRKDYHGNAAAEKGAHLFYTIGGTGVVTTALAGASSPFGEPIEDIIILRTGHFTARQLQKHMRGDIRNFVAYAYWSSADFDANLTERVRVFLLRHCFPTTQNRQYVNSWCRRALGWIFVVLLAQIVLSFVVLGLRFMGYDNIADILSMSKS